MNVLVVGSGGREHALCWKIAQSPLIEKLFCAPGNAGTSSIATNVPIDVLDIEGLLRFVIENKVDFTVVGPEAPLCEGIVDVFKEKGLLVFGPDKQSALLEGSKCYSKDFMNRHNIPTAESSEFCDKKAALEYVKAKMELTSHIVIKADGLAAGKGVIIAKSFEEAAAAIELCFEGAFGKAGSKVLIEEFLEGEEASILALTDGKTIIPLIPSQDHKRVGDGDTGPNTGGMGAYCPAPVVDKEMMGKIKEEILNPFLSGIQKDKLYYRGVIYVGIMITVSGPKVLEFNVRFGDPETQPIMMLLKSDLLDVLLKTSTGKLDEAQVEWHPEAAVCVVMASKGYPGSYEKGFVINGLDDAQEDSKTVVFHAGTKIANGETVTSGGRVLGVTSRGDNIEDAVQRAYNGVRKIAWDGVFYRNDIASKALKP